MNEEFDWILAQMPDLFHQLESSDLLSRDNLRQVPQQGVYVLYEESKPIYVGRSDHLKERLYKHSRPSSGHGSATFAFNLAKEEADRKGMSILRTRKQLEDDPDFKDMFMQAKKRVYRMKIRVVLVDDPALQTVFEVYVALTLKTPYNSFITH